jgi:hypothetical protein
MVGEPVPHFVERQTEQRWDTNEPASYHRGNHYHRLFHDLAYIPPLIIAIRSKPLKKIPVLEHARAADGNEALD